MIIDQNDDLHGFERRGFNEAGLHCPVFVSDTGQAPILLLHELPALTPEVAHLGRVLVAAGFRVYMPSLLGRPGQVPTAMDKANSGAQVCIRSEFNALGRGDHTRPIVAGLRRLAAQASDEANGASVGVLGLCLTGGFALAVALEAPVAAAVAAEPSLPLLAPNNVDLSPADQTALASRLRAGEVRAMVLRFQGDDLSPCGKLRRYGEGLGETLVSRCLDDEAADPRRTGKPRHHCVLTNHLVEAPGEQTLAVRDEVVAFFDWRLRNGPAPVATHGLPDCLATGCARRLGNGPRPRAPA